ncbi:DMT family transporter [Desulfovibrio oxyclinae]|jgi:small multidrug resistance pump|uniref:DMT family transporter n=1 Tax=Desulfovibrio oxyclinae TaxID=63560 RepID=UPI0003705623|nr:multidrug efflux SMR transporter [Desulfovibrio oxyclinae]
MMTYLYLALAIVAEVAATMALKALSDEFRVGTLALVVGGYVTAFTFLCVVLRTLPVGIGYAIWAGLGTALVVLCGALIYRQVPDLWALTGIGLIVAGVVCINVLSKTNVH